MNYTQLYVFGSNSYAQLGIEEAHLDQPKSIHFHVKIAQIACGGYFTLLLLESGDMYGFNLNDGQPLPKLLPLKQVTQVTCGLWHILAQVNSIHLYSWGQNDDGQLGLGDYLARKDPTIIDLPKRPFTLICGQFHSIIYEEDGMYTFGRGKDGQLWHTQNTYCNPYRVQLDILKIAAGETQTLILLKNGNLLENCNVIPLDNNVVQIACGKGRSAALNSDFLLYIWSCNQYSQMQQIKNVRAIKMFANQLILQKLSYQLYFEDQLIPIQDRIDSFYMGMQHSLFIIEQLNSQKETLLLQSQEIENKSIDIQLLEKDRKIAELQLELAKKDAIIAKLILKNK